MLSCLLPPAKLFYLTTVAFIVDCPWASLSQAETQTRYEKTQDTGVAWKTVLRDTTSALEYLIEN